MIKEKIVWGRHDICESVCTLQQNFEIYEAKIFIIKRKNRQFHNHY